MAAHNIKVVLMFSTPYLLSVSYRSSILAADVNDAGVMGRVPIRNCSDRTSVQIVPGRILPFFKHIFPIGVFIQQH